MADKHYIGRDLMGFKNNGKTPPVSRVTLTIDDENAVTAGDDSGREITSVCPHATQAMADAILERIKGYQYQMYTASGVNIDPAAEPGDGVTLDGVYGVLSQITDDGGGYPDLTGPGEAELEDEFPMDEGPTTKEFNRKLEATRSAIYSRITKTEEQIRLEITKEVEGLTSSFDMKLGNIRTEITDAVNDLSTSIDLQLGIIDEQVSGLDGRLGEVEITAESVTQRVNGLDDAYAQIRTEVDEITSKVSGLDGQFTLLEQTASGLTTTVNGLGGQFTTLEQTVKDFTFLGPDGRVMINNGNLDLTGAITFSDLDNSTQNVINSAKTRTFKTQPTGPYYVGDLWYKDDGTVWRCKTDEPRNGLYFNTDWEQVQNASITQDIVHTLITNDLMESPTVKGADIYGGAYHDLNNAVTMSLIPEIFSGVNSATFDVQDARGERLFRVSPTIGGYSASDYQFLGAQLNLGGITVFRTRKLENRLRIVPDELDIECGTVEFDSGCTVDFSKATVTGLKGLGVDYVTEQSTYGYWTYRKWVSGIVECWARREVGGITVTNKWGNVFSTATATFSSIAYPVTFANPPSVQVTPENTGAADWWVATYADGTGSQCPSYQICRGSEKTDVARYALNYYVIGKI